MTNTNVESKRTMKPMRLIALIIALITIVGASVACAQTKKSEEKNVTNIVTTKNEERTMDYRDISIPGYLDSVSGR